MNTPANTRKSATSSHSDLNKLMKYNSPLCIVKLARDDLKTLDYGKKINSIKRDAKTANPQTTIDKETEALIKDSNLGRAQSAMDKRLFQDGTPLLPPKAENTRSKVNLDLKTQSFKRPENPAYASMKSPKGFKIRSHKRSGSNEGSRKFSDDNIFTASDQKDLSLPFKVEKVSLFAGLQKRILEDSCKTISEEKKTESSESSTKTVQINSTSDKECKSQSVETPEATKEMIHNANNNVATFLDITRDRSNSGIILRKGGQIDFDAKLGDIVGEGAYGQVYSSLNLDSGEFLAIKHINLKYTNPDPSMDIKGLCKEIEVYQSLEHENIVKYIGAKYEGDSVYIYMEFMTGGSVASMVKQFGAFEEIVIRKFTRQVVAGLDYLHEKGVAHRDVKGGNILSDGNGNVKLADFGAAKKLEAVQGYHSLNNSEVCNSIKGSLYWMAPELLKGEKHGRKIDIWSLGCTVIEMATGKHPWPDVKSYPELVLEVMTKKCPPIPEHLSNEGKEFIQKCCQFDKKLRPRPKDLLNHPFLNLEDI